MRKKLFPYQLEGADFLIKHPHALLADEPGLGKTAQALAAAEAIGARKTIVVCPASVRLGWWQEIADCGLSDFASQWTIISYNQAKNLVGMNVMHDLIILDEAHFLKTPDSQRTQAVFGPGGIARHAKYKWALTGTPVLNRPRELYPLLKSLNPEFASATWSGYTQRYCGAFFDGYGMNTKGATNLSELRGKLGGFMIRREKSEVMSQLPPKLLSLVPLDIRPEELRELLDEESRMADREAKVSQVAEDFSQMGDLSRLLRLTGEAKTRAAVEYLAETLASGVSKIVVFARHREVISRLQKGLAAVGHASVVYHGGMSDTQKKEAVDEFRVKPDCAVFIGQIQAAGTGINGLQEVCSTVVFAELSWVPGETGQAVDRLHRIGQTANSVDIKLLHVPGSLESAILRAHTRKERVIEALIGATKSEVYP